ncbi:U3 snoRNP protein [Physocladia obscura]|uniref:U3 snoRNP protein n=1 Tax=Physocladia obscura TaxID=109957 RepID=A0AAD5TB27_9FUNG|nr:U3 snoRNP protein [Physocladia obscura]
MVGDSVEVNLTIAATPGSGRLRKLNASLRPIVAFLNDDKVAARATFPRPMSEWNETFSNLLVVTPNNPLIRQFHLLVDPEIAQATFESPLISVKTILRLQITTEDSEVPNVSKEFPIVVVPPISSENSSSTVLTTLQRTESIMESPNFAFSSINSRISADIIPPLPSPSIPLPTSSTIRSSHPPVAFQSVNEIGSKSLEQSISNSTQMQSPLTLNATLTDPRSPVTSPILGSQQGGTSAIERNTLMPELEQLPPAYIEPHVEFADSVTPDTTDAPSESISFEFDSQPVHNWNPKMVSSWVQHLGASEETAQDEIKEIVRRRTTHEYAIHRRIGRRADFLKYIEYEINIERLRKKRKHRLGLDIDQKASNPGHEEIIGKKLLGFTLSDYSITQRINHLYQKALKKFQGDVNLWIQYFEWAKSMGSSNILGRSFAKAIQLHPLNPSMYILAAKYEFTDNGNMMSARVLMQRGIRMNKEATILWHEYFKLELLWAEKVKERRRILFGDKDTISDGDTAVKTTASAVANNVESKKRKFEFADDGNDNEEDDSNDDDWDAGVRLEDEEENGPKSQLDIDPAIVVSNDASAEDPALIISKNLTGMQKAMLELAIPKAIYRNAIKEIPNDLQFRIGFLNLYQLFGPTTISGQEVIYESIKADFPKDPIAVGVIAERHIAGLEVSHVNFPAALKSVVEEYDIKLKKIQTIAIWVKYTNFLNDTLSKVTESNLQRYVFVLLQKTYAAAHEENKCTPQMYISWVDLNTHDTKAQIAALNKGIERHPNSGLIWTTKLRILISSPVGVKTDGKVLEEVEKIFGAALGLVGKRPSDTLDAISAVPTTTVQTLDLKTERFELWKLYLEWISGMTKDNASADRIEIVEKRFRECLSVQEMGSASADTADFENEIISTYLKWSYAVGGIERVRKSRERLVSFKQRSVWFFNTCLLFEEREILGAHVLETGSLVYAAKKSADLIVTPSQITRLRRIHELICYADASRIDSWIAYLSFEMHVAKDIKRVTEVHWRANKEVTDSDEFALRYENLRVE